MAFLRGRESITIPVGGLHIEILTNLLDPAIEVLEVGIFFIPDICPYLHSHLQLHGLFLFFH